MMAYRRSRARPLRVRASVLAFVNVGTPLASPSKPFGLARSRRPR